MIFFYRFRLFLVQCYAMKNETKKNKITGIFKRKCPNCGATLKGGTHFCDYCGTDWTPPPPSPENRPIVPGSVPMGYPVLDSNKNEPWQLLVFGGLLFMCGPAAIIFMWASMKWTKQAKAVLTMLLVAPIAGFVAWGFFNDTKYNIQGEGLEYSANAPPAEQRQAEDITPEQIYKGMRETEGVDFEKQKILWIDTYAGKWVKWQAKVKNRYIYSSSAGKVELKIKPNAPFKIEVRFDPLFNDQLKALETGDIMTFSGRLWGYNQFSEEIRVADGLIEKVDKPEAPKQDAQTPPTDNPAPAAPTGTVKIEKKKVPDPGVN